MFPVVTNPNAVPESFKIHTIPAQPTNVGGVIFWIELVPLILVRRTKALLDRTIVAFAGINVAISAAQVKLGAGPLITNCVDALAVAVVPEKDTADV